MGERIGLGILGCGRMGSAHARIVAGLVPEARLVALGDVAVASARRLALYLVRGAPAGSGGGDRTTRRQR